jgi:hypothetical protein
LLKFSWTVDAGSGLSVQQLEALIKMAPTKEEVEKLAAYDGDVEGLVPAERLVKLVLTVPCAFVRVEAMLYRETFADEVGHIRKSFAMLEVSRASVHNLLVISAVQFQDCT